MMAAAIAHPYRRTASPTDAHTPLSALRPVSWSERPFCAVAANGLPSIRAVTTIASEEFHGARLADVTSVRRSSLLGPYRSSSVMVSLAFFESDPAAAFELEVESSDGSETVRVSTVRTAYTVCPCVV